MKNIENAWAVNETLLQSYRSTFIASQSFLLVVGIILLNTIVPQWLMGLVCFLALLMIWYVWFRIVVVRARVVDYYKFQLITNVSSHKNFCNEEKEYISDKSKRDAMNKAAGKKNWRLTRKKVDLFLPVLFSIIWVALFYAKFSM